MYYSNPEYYLHQPGDATAIMDIESFDHPIISYDTSKDISKIMDAKGKEPVSKNKPLLAIVRGHGTGKSRILEALR